jgi:hypothetical protein
MQCRDIQLNMQKQLDGALSQAKSQEFLAHMAVCPACRAEFAKWENMEIILSSHLASVEPPPDFAAGVMTALKNKAPRVLPVRKISWHRYAAAAAAILLIIGAASLGLFGTPDVNWLDPNQTPSISNIEIPPRTDNPNIIAKTEEPSDPGTTDIGENSGNTEDPYNEDPENTGNPENNDTPGNTQPDNPSPDRSQSGEPGEPANQGSGQAQPQNPPVTQEPDPGQEETPSISGQVVLPTVAYSSAEEGNFSRRLLAEHEDASALRPIIAAAGKVHYYLRHGSSYQLWEQDLDPVAEPVMLEESTQPDINSQSWQGEAKNSPDNAYLAVNGYDEKDQVGLWIYKNNDQEPQLLSSNGGGKILAIAPNSNKIAFTDEAGNLYIAYVAEKRVYPVFEAEVGSCSWSADSKTLVLDCRPGGKKYSAVYAITIP